VAKEAEDGTLRMILSRPVSRFRLLLVKWLAGLIFSMILVAVLGGTAVGLRGSGFVKGMFVPGLKIHYSASWEASEGFKLYAAAHVLMAINASVVLGMGFMFRALT